MFSASSRKSSSSTICSANSSTSAGGFASAATGMRPTSNGDEPRERAQVLAHERRDSWPLDLHDDLLAGDEAGRVHLRDRRRGERLGRELGEDLLERPPEVALHDRAHVGERARAAPGRAAS